MLEERNISVRLKYNTSVEYFAFKLCLTLKSYISGTINDMKTAQGTRPCSKVILHQNFLDILYFKLFFENKSFSKVDKNNVLKQIVPSANKICQ